MYNVAREETRQRSDRCLLLSSNGGRDQLKEISITTISLFLFLSLPASGNRKNARGREGRGRRLEREIKQEIRKNICTLCETRRGSERASERMREEIDNVMEDYTVAPNPAPSRGRRCERNRMYGGTIGPATLLKGG